MTKRDPGKFERVERDFYRTPPKAVHRLMPWIRKDLTFAEPLCGDGAIIEALCRHGWKCNWASDIEPRAKVMVVVKDVLTVTEQDLAGCQIIVSNPPWPRPGKSGQPTVQIIEHLMKLRRTWLLLSADFAHCGYARPLLAKCRWIVSVGRVSWMGNNVSGLDNCAWYCFDRTFDQGYTQFVNTPLTSSFPYGLIDDIF